jgi:LysM repeat protein
MADLSQNMQQKQAMEMQRFGDLRSNIIKPGQKCQVPLQFPGDFHKGKLAIHHEKGGGRHDTENGKIIPGKTHNKNEFIIACLRHAGMLDRKRGLAGVGTKGNPNNPSQ